MNVTDRDRIALSVKVIRGEWPIMTYYNFILKTTTTIKHTNKPNQTFRTI